MISTLKVKTAESEEEEEDESGTISLADLTLQHLRDVPYVMASLVHTLEESLINHFRTYQNLKKLFLTRWKASAMD
jgi:hypothetical protein